MLNWSSNYYEGLDEFQHQTNDMWFYRMRKLLNDDGVLYVPDLNKHFNKSFNKLGQEVENTMARDQHYFILKEDIV